MKKYRKQVIIILFLMHVLLFCVELIVYLNNSNSLFAVFYLFIDLICIFLFFPIILNYNKYKSVPRISKLIIISFLSFFNSFILKLFIFGLMKYTDLSNEYIHSIFLINYFIKPFLNIILIYFIFLEFHLKNRINSKFGMTNFID